MDVLQSASVLGDGHVAVALLALGIGVALIGWGVPRVRARWREALGFGPVLPAPRPQPMADFDLLATTIIGKAYDHGRARYREVVVERTTGGIVVSLSGQVVGPITARKARDLIVEHLRGAA